MTLAALQEPNLYGRASDLTGTASPETAVTWTEPGAIQDEAMVLKKLGDRGWGRLYAFIHFYGPHWGETRNQPLSPKALRSFYAFLIHVQFPEGILPSIFLTNDGHLELCWEDEHKNAIQVEFGPETTAYYLEASQSEGEILSCDTARLAQQLTH